MCALPISILRVFLCKVCQEGTMIAAVNSTWHPWHAKTRSSFSLPLCHLLPSNVKTFYKAVKVFHRKNELAERFFLGHADRAKKYDVRGVSKRNYAEFRQTSPSPGTRNLWTKKNYKYKDLILKVDSVKCRNMGTGSGFSFQRIEPDTDQNGRPYCLESTRSRGAIQQKK